MSGVIDVISRPIGADDISFGANSFVYVDVNGVPRRLGQVNAASLPWLSIPGSTVEGLVDGSKSLPVGASSLAVAGTSTFSGPMIGSGTTSGLVFNDVNGRFLFGQAVPAGAIPTGIPAVNIAAGAVDNTEYGYLNGATSNIQAQIDGLQSSVAAFNFQHFWPMPVPLLYWSSATIVNIRANTDTPAWIRTDGFPDLLNPGQFIAAGISTSTYYGVTTQTSLTFPDNLYGDEKASQWYAVYGVGSGGTYTLRGMPFLRVRGEASQVVSTGLNLTPATANDYNFTINQFVSGYLYVLSGSKQGELRLITANSAAAGCSTFTYSGTALSLTQEDWFIVLPPAVDFRHIGEVFNNSASDVDHFVDTGSMIEWVDGAAPGYSYDLIFNVTNGVSEGIFMCSPLSTEMQVNVITDLNGGYVGSPNLGSSYVGMMTIAAPGGGNGYQRGSFVVSSPCKLYCVCSGVMYVIRVSYRKVGY